MQRLLALSFFAAFPALAHSEQFNASTNSGSAIPAIGTGGNGAIWPTQLPADPAVSQITLTHEVGMVTSVQIFNLHHTSAGDLQAALRDPNGNYHNLFVRSGFDGNATWNQGDFVGAGINFVTSGTTPFPGGTNTNIGPATYTQDFGNSGTPPAPWPNGSAGVANTPLNQIFGPAGTWSLVIFDWGSGEVGSFTGWALNGVRPSIEPTCFGDGTVLPCPCANDGLAGRGCNNSSNTGGALLTASGSFTPDTIVLTSTGERPTSLTIFVQAGNGTPVPFGDGIGCLAGSSRRLYTKSAVGGVASAPGPGDPSITQRNINLGAPIPHGNTLYYQAYYRDVSATFCPPNTFNVSNGLRITWP